jgi:hypothetical protein
MDVRCIHNGYWHSCKKCQGKAERVIRKLRKENTKKSTKTRNTLILVVEFKNEFRTGDELLSEIGKLIQKRYNKRILNY